MSRVFKVMSRRTKVVLVGLFLLVVVPCSVGDFALFACGRGDTLSADVGYGRYHAQFEDGSWQVVNDLGITVTVDKGYLASYSVQLLACEHEHGLLQGILGFLTIPTVSAGHWG